MERLISELTQTQLRLHVVHQNVTKLKLTVCEKAEDRLLRRDDDAK